MKSRQENAAQILLRIYEETNANLFKMVSRIEILNKCGLNTKDGASSALYLKQKNFIRTSFTDVGVTTEGIDEAERIMAETYAQKETRVLKKIYDLSGQDTLKLVGFHELLPAIEMTDRELSGVCKGLEDQQFIEWPEDSVLITRNGIRAIDSLGQPPSKASGDTYNLSIGTSQGPIQQGPGNTQNINITNNPEFDQAIAGLLQLVEVSRLPADEIEELRDEVVKLNRLALSEPKPGLLEKAKARIDVMNVSFEGAKLLVHAAPYLRTAWEYFKAKYS